MSCYDMLSAWKMVWTRYLVHFIIYKGINIIILEANELLHQQGRDWGVSTLTLPTCNAQSLSMYYLGTKSS